MFTGLETIGNKWFVKLAALDTGSTVFTRSFVELNTKNELWHTYASLLLSCATRAGIAQLTLEHEVHGKY